MTQPIEVDKPRCPVWQWMEENGQSPNKGYITVLPEILRAEVVKNVGFIIPRYIRFSPTLKVPVIVKDERIEL